MKPITPIIPGRDLPVTKIAESQAQYTTLPAYVDPQARDGFTLSRWRLSWPERLRVLLTGDLWLTILTFRQPFQPIRLDTRCPTLPVHRPFSSDECFCGRRLMQTSARFSTCEGCGHEPVFCSCDLLLVEEGEY
jgi:hypothetical protein